MNNLNIREKTNEENERIFEKECIYFNYEYKGKNHSILLTIPKIFKVYEKNDVLFEKLRGKMNKYLYKLLVCNKNMDYIKSVKLFNLIHWGVLAGYDTFKKVEDYKFIENDFKKLYCLYSI